MVKGFFFIIALFYKSLNKRQVCTAQPLFLALRNEDLRDDIPQDETMNGRLAGRDITYNPLLTQCMSKDEMSKTKKD